MLIQHITCCKRDQALSLVGQCPGIRLTWLRQSIDRYLFVLFVETFLSSLYITCTCSYIVSWQALFRQFKVTQALVIVTKLTMTKQCQLTHHPSLQCVLRLARLETSQESYLDLKSKGLLLLASTPPICQAHHFCKAYIPFLFFFHFMTLP